MNGNARLLQWLMGILAALFLGAVGLVIHGMHNDLAAVRLTQQARGERIAALEAQATANKEHILTIKADVNYIKQRLDQLISGPRGAKELQ